MAAETSLNIEFDPQSLKKILDEKNISQMEFARLAGYPHRNVITKILKKNRDVTATELLRFSTILDKRPEDFAKIGGE